MSSDRSLAQRSVSRTETLLARLRTRAKAHSPHTPLWTWAMVLPLPASAHIAHVVTPHASSLTASSRSCTRLRSRRAREYTQASHHTQRSQGTPRDATPPATRSTHTRAARVPGRAHMEAGGGRARRAHLPLFPVQESARPRHLIPTRTTRGSGRARGAHSRGHSGLAPEHIGALQAVARERAAASLSSAAVFTGCAHWP